MKYISEFYINESVKAILKKVGGKLVKKITEPVKKAAAKATEPIKKSAEEASKKAERAVKATEKLEKTASKTFGAAATTAAIMTLTTITAGILMIRKALRERLHGDCAKMHGSRLNVCKMQAYNHALTQLKKYSKSCLKTTDPPRCKEKIKNAIESIERKKNRILTGKVRMDVP
ncbi:MAG: hypothetical protein KAS32_26245 [Candidatus Peribacteraceae bacterium]|nr:hypothetical protein [Candidatus Peribacteraceae bacterium]